MTAVCKSCGHPLRGRSNPDHRRLFALIKAAYDQWPETAHFQPINAEHLRSWLVCSAGPDWRNVVTHDVSDLDSEARMSLLKMIKDEHTHAGTKGNLIYKVTPKSMRFDKMSQGEFGALREAIEEVIEQNLGVTCDELLREKETAA